MNSKQFKKRIIALGSIFLLLTVIYLFSSGLLSTISRYIRREQDEIKAYYTSLYFDTDGNGKSIAIESSVGYVEFSLMNYIADNVTQRDIEYKIVKPSKFYDVDGKEIVDANSNGSVQDELADAEKLYVLDVWGQPQEVAKSTYLYTLDIVSNTGESAGSGNYKFTYEKLGTSAVGKIHHVNLKLTRSGEELESDEDVSIVVQLEKPYREVFIINMKASSRIIAFSVAETKKFDVIFDEVHIQTADLFAFFKSGVERTSRPYMSGSDSLTDKFTPKAVKLTFNWTGFILDETDLEILHNGTLGHPDEGTTGSTINGDLTYIDIKKSTIASINATGNSGELVIFVPQSSDFALYFLQAGTTGSSSKITVKIEIYVYNASTEKYEYVIYDDKYFGFTLDANKLYTLTNQTN